VSDAKIETKASGSTKVVMLGTGTPRPDPDRSGPATAVVVNDTAYIVDFGPGVVRRATAAFQAGILPLGFGASNVTTAFLTHLHSDHTLGLPDLIFTPWVMGRRQPLKLYGPKGLADMTDHIMKAWEIDINARTAGKNKHNGDGYKIEVTEIEPGFVFDDGNVRVTAFAAHHEEMVDSFSFRFDGPDRSIVISGDTSPTDTLVEMSRGCNILIHEAYSMYTYERVAANHQDFRRRHHTSSKELAAIANQVKPDLLVIYHRSNAGGGRGSDDPEEILLEEIKSSYAGAVVSGHDLDVF
jgi:ribonuclease BN (tRNA processing enzyme)